MREYIAETVCEDDITYSCTEHCYHREDDGRCTSLERKIPEKYICKEEYDNSDDKTRHQCEETDEKKTHSVYLGWTEDFLCTDGDIIECILFHRIDSK